MVLSDTGTRQAEELASALCSLPIGRIYSSPLERALQTAAPLADSLGISVVEDEDLIEADCGEWAGLTFRQVPRLRSFKMLSANPLLRRPPGGESLAEVQARMLRFVERVAGTASGGIVAAFSHADPIKTVVAALLGCPLESYRRFEVGVASVSVVVMDDGPLMVCHNADGRRAAEALTAYVELRSHKRRASRRTAMRRTGG